MEKIWNAVTSPIPFCVRITRHYKVMHRIALMTLKTFLYYLCSTESWSLNVRLGDDMVVCFSRATNFVRVRSKCHLSITHKWIKYWLYQVSLPCTQLGAEMRSEACQLQRNTQLRASLFSAKIWYERLNVMAKCVSDGVLSGNYNVQPPSLWLFHGSVTLFLFLFFCWSHLSEQECSYFNQQMCLNWLHRGLCNASVTGVTVYF